MADLPAPEHRRPDGVDDATVEAVGRLTEALETVERARGHLYSFHQLTGEADFKIGDAVEIVGLKPNKASVITGIEAFNKTLDTGEAGENVGVLLRGVEKDDLERGQVLAAPKSITPHTKFEAEVYVLTKEEGGRHTPFFTGYRPQFYFRTTDVTGTAKLLGGAEMVMPGDNVTMEIELMAPIAMEEKLRFAVREGGKTVGSGVVTEILG